MKLTQLRDKGNYPHSSQTFLSFPILRCADCGKGFVGSNALKTHMMNVHIKARPYACRYGCGAAYNDSSNRGHHERKKHGSNYTPAAATGPPTALPQIQHHHQQQQQR